MAKRRKPPGGAVPFGADGLDHPGYRPDPPPPDPPYEAARVDRLAADILLGRAEDHQPEATVPETGQPPYDWDRVREIGEANRKPAESLADRLKREAAAAAARRDAEAAAARAKAEREGLDALARADRLYAQLQSLEGVWLGNVPSLDVVAGGSTRLRRHVGQVVIRKRDHAHDHNGCRRSRHGVGLVLHNTGRNAVALRLVDWVTGWVNPKGHRGDTFLTARWVIDDYNSPMAKLPLLMGQKPRTEEEAVELTLDLLREFVLPDPPPGAEPAEPGVTPTRPGLDL